MLTGSSPFYHRREIVMLRSIMDAKYSIDGPDWKGISILAKKLIKKLLTLDQHQRITAEEALQDEWFQESATTEIIEPVEIDSERQDQRRLTARRRFRGLVYCIIMVQHLKQKLPIRVEKAKENPYIIRPLRVFIDNAAFRVYGHWVKKHNSVQERNALFQRHLHRPYY
jgi:phosphorylase kinase gamma subunit